MEGREKLIDQLTGIYNLEGFYKATEELLQKIRIRSISSPTGMYSGLR